MRQLFAVMQGIAEPPQVLSTTDNRRKTMKNDSCFIMSLEATTFFLWKLIKIYYNEKS